MGVDITLHIVENKQYVFKDIFEGRAYDWFESLCQNNKDVYQYLQINAGFSSQMPDEDKKFIIENCYDFHYINVGDFIDWYFTYFPNLTAGWVSKKDAWAYRVQKVIPTEIYDNLPNDYNIENFEFLEMEDRTDYSKEIYHFIIDNNISRSADIIYWFDC